MEELFWLNEPSILFRKDKILEFWPYMHMTFTQKLNATTRFILYISLFGFALLNNYLILLFGIILILLIVYLYSTKNKIEGFDDSELTKDAEKYSAKNPLYNVMLTDYEDDVNKPALQTEYDETHEESINKNVKNFVLENNKDNKDIGKIFKDVGNNIEFESSMRQFHMNPSTTIPNDQNDFLKYCYGDLPSEKSVTVY
jgi:cbb3-type cytochrome oxidase subunit 3|tara:strand:- start:6028 stop:6624 length:597 start_codon:yes stop_codon:yes gene_type:complete